MLAVSRRSPLAARDRMALAEAADEPFIMYPQERVPGLFGLAMMRCQHSGFSPRIEQEAMQIQTIVSLVAVGLGIALARLRGDSSRLLDRVGAYARDFAARRGHGQP